MLHESYSCLGQVFLADIVTFFMSYASDVLSVKSAYLALLLVIVSWEVTV